MLERKDQFDRDVGRARDGEVVDSGEGSRFRVLNGSRPISAGSLMPLSRRLPRALELIKRSVSDGGRVAEN